MESASSRRILAVGARDSGVLTVIQDLTGSAPTPDVNGSVAGSSHTWDVQTRYYTARVPIWIDEIVDVTAWRREFLRAEAGEVVAVVGAWVYCFRETADGAEIARTLEAIDAVMREHGGDEDVTHGPDVVRLAVAVAARDRPPGAVALERSATREELEDACLEHGFELVQHGATGKDAFGESQGIERLCEALEANVWSGETNAVDESAADGFVSDMGDYHADANTEIARLEAEWTSELFDLKASLIEGDEGEDEHALATANQATQVDDLDRILGQLSLVKEQTAHLPEAQRKRIAAKAVMDIMRPFDRP